MSLRIENDGGRVTLEQAGYVQLVWYPLASSQQVRALFEQALRWLSTRSTGCLLLDQRQATPYTPADCAWLRMNWAPRYLRQGMARRVAVLAGYEYFVHLATSRMAQYARQQFGVRYHYFEAEQEDDAIEWLLRGA